MLAHRGRFFVSKASGTHPGRRWQHRSARCAPLEQLEPRCLLSPGHGHHHEHSAAAHGGREIANLVYEVVGSHAESLDVYLPGGTPPPGGWPILMAIHGGGWRRFSKEEYGPEVAPMFNQAGIAVVAMNYTLSARGGPSWPVNFEEVRNAVRWTKTNAAQFGLDPNRIAAIGESAGGHLAALLGTNPDRPVSAEGDSAAANVYGSVSAQVQAVVDFYGPTDLVALDAQSPAAAPAVERFLGGKPGQIAQSYLDASPVDHVSSSSAPMLILQGGADTLVPPGQSHELAGALTAAGVRNNLIVVADAPHGFEFQPSGRKLLPVILDFLRSIWQG